MAEFTVQELFDRLERDSRKLRLRHYYGKWTIDDITFDPTKHCIASGTTPDELRKALEELAVPTAEEAEVALYSLPLDMASDKVRLLIRFIEAHKEQADE